MENNEKVFAGFLMLMAVWSPLAAFAALVSVIVLRLIFCFSVLKNIISDIFVYLF